jgi:hypothetical protein
MLDSGHNTNHQTPGGAIELHTQRNRVYARLRWRRGDKGRYLGLVPNTPTGLLDLALQKGAVMDLYGLQRLLAANKSARW